MTAAAHLSSAPPGAPPLDRSDPGERPADHPPAPSAAAAFGGACTLVRRHDPALVRWTWPVPADARPLLRFTDPVAVADEVSIAAAEAGRDDVQAVLLAVFEAVVDAVLLLPLAAMRAGHPAVVLDLEHTCVLLGPELRPAGLWPVLVRDPEGDPDGDRGTGRGVRPAVGRDLDAVVTAFAPYTTGGAPALRSVADARAALLLGHLGRGGAAPAAGR